MENEIAIFQPNAETQIVTRFDGETFWLTQKEIAAMFGCSRVNVTLHLKNAQDEELRGISVCKDFLLTAADGKTYTVKVYNLDAVMSVGYRVKSPRGVQFRRWANAVIKERLLRRPEKTRELAALEERVKRLEKRGKMREIRRLRTVSPRSHHAKDFAISLLTEGGSWTIAKAIERFGVKERQIWRYIHNLGWRVKNGIIVPKSDCPSQNCRVFDVSKTMTVSP